MSYCVSIEDVFPMSFFLFPFESFFERERERGYGKQCLLAAEFLPHGGSLAAVRFYYYMVARADHVRGVGAHVMLVEPTE